MSAHAGSRQLSARDSRSASGSARQPSSHGRGARVAKNLRDHVRILLRGDTDGWALSTFSGIAGLSVLLFSLASCSGRYYLWGMQTIIISLGDDTITLTCDLANASAPLLVDGQEIG